MVEYASAIWDPHTRRNINKLEQVQHHSARYVTGNHNYTSSISAMLRDLEWPTLEQRRHLSRYAVQNLQPFGQHWFHILAYTETVQYQRSCISLPTTTVQLCCLLQLVPSWYCLGLECTGGGSTTFSNCGCLQELPLHWSVVSSLPFLTYFFIHRKRGLPSHCAFVFLYEVALLTEEEEEEEEVSWYRSLLGPKCPVTSPTYINLNLTLILTLTLTLLTLRPYCVKTLVNTYLAYCLKCTKIFHEYTAPPASIKAIFIEGFTETLCTGVYFQWMDSLKM